MALQWLFTCLTNLHPGGVRKTKNEKDRSTPELKDSPLHRRPGKYLTLVSHVACRTVIIGKTETKKVFSFQDSVPGTHHPPNMKKKKKKFVPSVSLMRDILFY